MTAAATAAAEVGAAAATQERGELCRARGDGCHPGRAVQEVRPCRVAGTARPGAAPLAASARLGEAGADRQRPRDKGRGEHRRPQRCGAGRAAGAAESGWLRESRGLPGAAPRDRLQGRRK